MLIMKKNIFTFIFILLPMVASADPVEINGIWYNLIPKGNIAEVTKFQNGEYPREVNIPEKVIYEKVEYTVTKIGESAFTSSRVLATVVIPNTVTSIDITAFSGCKKLSSVTIGTSVATIGTSAFYGCSSLTSIEIPSSVTTIGEKAFYGCSGLKSLTIPNSVTSIGSWAFQYCNGMESITLPTELTVIGWATFYGCSSLKSIILPNKVTTIANQAFYDCTNLTSVTFGNSITGIGASAFYNCTGLKSITIPSCMTLINKNTFQKCSQLTDVYCMPEQVREKSGSTGLYTDPDAFADSYQEYITLHVPSASIEAYRALEPWKSFKTIVATDGDAPDNPETPKCAKPVISFAGGKLSFSCATEGATCNYAITNEDIKSGIGNEVSLGLTYHISVYASKEGYDNSDVATMDIVITGDNQATGSGQAIVIGDMDGNGVLNAVDVVKLVDKIMGR